MSVTWTIEPLDVGTFPVFEKSVFTYNRNAGTKIVAPCLAWLLRSEDETVLIDTGPPSPELTERWHQRITRTPEQELANALRAKGVNPESIQTVVFTHLHWDHCYSLECLPAARFFVQGSELRAAVDPILSQRLTYEASLPGLRPPWLDVFDRIKVVHGEQELLPGLRLVTLPGHTPGLQGVAVETQDGLHLVASDSVALYENLGEEGGDPIAPGIHTDVASCFDTFAKIRAMGAVVLPGHDIRVLDVPRYPRAETTHRR